MNLRRDFASRADLEAYLHEQFPDAEGSLAPTPGGRAAAEKALDAFTPARYPATRNFTNGAVSRLSPYIRHGVLTLREVLDRFPKAPDKFIQELAWRDYWRRVHAQIGDGVWRDQERSKTGVSSYANRLPDDFGHTGVACMDAFVAELESTGYLHNHARMWFAAWLIHWRRVDWRIGARWFLRHLLDGDPASNNLSWQWVASTFGAKPYFFNRENLEHYTAARYCPDCPSRRNCPFNDTYDALSAKLFPIVQS